MDPTALVAAWQCFSVLSVARGLGKLRGQRERMETSDDNEGPGGDEDETEPARRRACRKLLHGRTRKDISMGNPVFAEGSRVRVVSSSPFRGLKGTIRIVHRIAPLDEPFCFYQIELEGAHVKEPIWFAYEEVELLTSHEGLLLTSDTKSA